MMESPGFARIFLFQRVCKCQIAYRIAIFKANQKT